MLHGFDGKSNHYDHNMVKNATEMPQEETGTFEEHHRKSPIVICNEIPSGDRSETS